jgi:hypothetical protein
MMHHGFFSLIGMIYKVSFVNENTSDTSSGVTFTTISFYKITSGSTASQSPELVIYFE